MLLESNSTDTKTSSLCLLFCLFSKMKSQYKIKDFMPVWFAWQCSITCMAWIINYFYDTFFGSKDIYDLSTITKFGHGVFGEVLSIQEIALFLERSYFDVTIFSGMTPEEWNYLLVGDDADKMVEIYKKYIDPKFHHCINWSTRTFEEGWTMEMVNFLVQKRLSESKVKFTYELDDEGILKTFKDNQDLDGWSTLFLLWLDYNILYDETPEWNESAGHMVLTTWIDENDNFIIHEPIRPRPNPILIPKEKVLKALHFLEPYEFLMIKNNLE